MKKITVALMRDLEKQVLQGDISYSRMVEILNETVQPTEPATEKEPVRIPTRDEIYAKGSEYADSQSNGEINAYYDGYTTCLNDFSVYLSPVSQTKGLDITDEEIKDKQGAIVSETKCSDCEDPMNENYAKTFTCCDKCWDKQYKKGYVKSYEEYLEEKEFILDEAKEDFNNALDNAIDSIQNKAHCKNHNNNDYQIDLYFDEARKILLDKFLSYLPNPVLSYSQSKQETDGNNN